MKQMVLLQLFMFFSMLLPAQELMMADLVANSKEAKKDPAAEEAVTKSNAFVFDGYGELPKSENEIEEHFLGEIIAHKWSAVNQLFIKKSSVSVGFGDSYVETLKPSVFNAVYKMNSFYKKACNKNVISITEAAKQFDWVLDCALAAYYSPDSKAFEEALVGKRKPEEILEVFNSVILK